MSELDLTWLQRWYQQHCDGEWEHQYGVRIDTLDNPGWLVTIDLTDTDLASRTMAPIKQGSDDDWLHLEVKDSRFVAAGDPTKLIEILKSFRRWASGE